MTTINKKVRNATKAVVDGIKFDSKLEAHFYGLLRLHRIGFHMKEKFVLQSSFSYGAEVVKEIYILPDFIVPLEKGILIIDTKGFQTAENKIKVKLLKHYLNMRYCKSFVLTPSTNAECQSAIAFILKELGR